MKPKLHLCLALVLGGAMAILAQGEPSPLFRVVAVPSQIDVCDQGNFRFTLLVENVSKTNQFLHIGDQEPLLNWQPDNPDICVTSFNPLATANVEIVVTIPPGGAYTNEICVCICKPVSAWTLTFRLGCTAYFGTAAFGVGKIEEQTLWSDNIKLRALPPDTWEHDGNGCREYYRDRNHDGKIDWEVSGRTRNGDLIVPSGFKRSTNSDESAGITGGWTGWGVDIIKVDTNYDGYFDLEYGFGGANGQIQWTKPIHEPVPVVGKDFVPVAKQIWMDWLKE